MSQVHVFVAAGGQSQAAAVQTPPVRSYLVGHNSFDFTGLTHIVENPQLFREVRQWFYMHDTFAVGPGFWPNVTRWCESGLPACALPLTRSLPSASTGVLAGVHAVAPTAAPLGLCKAARPSQRTLVCP